MAAQQTGCHAAHGVCCGHRRATRSQLPQRRLCVPQAARLRSAVVHCCATNVAGYAERSALHRACVDRRRGCCCRRRSSSAHRRHSRICRRYVDPSQSSHVGAFSTRRGPPTLAAPEDIFLGFWSRLLFDNVHFGRSSMPLAGDQNREPVLQALRASDWPRDPSGSGGLVTTSWQRLCHPKGCGANSAMNSIV